MTLSTLQAAPQQFEFDKTFQTRVLALMQQDLDFLILAHDSIQPNYFTDPTLVWFFKTFRDHYLDYQMRMSTEALWHEMKKDAQNKRIKHSDIQAHITVFKMLETPVTDKKYITEQVTNFCRSQALRSAIIESIPLLAKNNFDAIKDTLGEAFQVGTNTMDLGSPYFVRWPERLAQRAARQELAVVATGITELDEKIGGGLKAGQLGIWMAPTNRGKSIALVHCGKRAVIERLNVIHYTLEMTVDEIEERYDASFSEVRVNDLCDEVSKVASSMEYLGRSIGNSLYVKMYPAKSVTVDTIRSHIRQCSAIGFVPDLILIDYLDLLKPPYKRLNKREELTDITEALKGLALELQIPIWTATQSRRAAASKDVHDEEDVAEDWGKMHATDIVITLNQSKEQMLRSEKGVHQMLLLVAKNRNGPRHAEVIIQGNFAYMCFFLPGGDIPDHVGIDRDDNGVKKSPPKKFKMRTGAAKHPGRPMP
jgi:replicative DNA helicase